MYPLPSIWLESWNRTIKRMIEVNSGKNSDLYHVRQIARLDWSKTVKQFSVKSRRKFHSWHEWQGEQASKQVDSSFPLSDKYFSAFWLVLYSRKICCTFHLEKLYIRFLTIAFDFYWSLALQLSCITVRLSDSIFLFPLPSD